MVPTITGRQDGRIKICRKHLSRNCKKCSKKNELKPWKVKGWVIPPEKSGGFVANMEQVLDVYKIPYNAEFPVICMDESPKQLIEEGKPSVAMKPGQDARVDYEYIRHGVVNIFMANEPLKGKRFVEVTEFKTKKEWALFVKRIADEWYPKAKKITLVMDNFKTHVASAFMKYLSQRKQKGYGTDLNLFTHPNMEAGLIWPR